MIRLGTWERSLLAAQVDDNSFCAGWAVELTAPLDPDRVIDVLSRLAPVFPLYFSRVVLDENGIGAWAEPLATAEIHALVNHRASLPDGGRGCLRALAERHLDPLTNGLLRILLVDGPVPVFGLQLSHIAGDGYSHGRLRQMLALALDDNGPRAASSPWPAKHDLPLAAVRRVLPASAAAVAGLADRLTRFAPPLALPVNDPPGAAGVALRSFQLRTGVDRFAEVIARARRAGATPLAVMASAFSLAVAGQTGIDRSRYTVINVPRDMRGKLDCRGQIGNLTLPQALPVFFDDPDDCDARAVLLTDRLARGHDCRLFYRHFLAEIEARAAAPIARDRPRGPCAAPAIEPFSAFGVTEIAADPVEKLGDARIVAAFFQTPMLTRRIALGCVHLSCTVRWHPDIDKQLRTLFGHAMALLFGGPPPAWELI